MKTLIFIVLLSVFVYGIAESRKPDRKTELKVKDEKNAENKPLEEKSQTDAELPKPVNVGLLRFLQKRSPGKHSRERHGYGGYGYGYHGGRSRGGRSHGGHSRGGHSRRHGGRSRGRHSGPRSQEYGYGNYGNRGYPSNGGRYGGYNGQYPGYRPAGSVHYPGYRPGGSVQYPGYRTGGSVQYPGYRPGGTRYVITYGSNRPSGGYRPSHGGSQTVVSNCNCPFNSNQEPDDSDEDDYLRRWQQAFSSHPCCRRSWDVYWQNQH